MTADIGRNSGRIGLLGTAAVWILLALCMIFISPNIKQEPEYKTVQISLAPLSQSEALPAPEPPKAAAPAPISAATAEAATAPAVTASAVTAPAQESAPAAPAATAPAVTVPAPAPKSAAPAKSAVSSAPKAQAAPAPEPVQQTLVKSVEQLIAESAAAVQPKTAVSDVNWDDIFADETVSASSSSAKSSPSAVRIAQTDALQGSAASASRQQSASAQDTASSRRLSDTAAGAGTEAALNRIAASSQYKTSSGSGTIQYTVTADTAFENSSGSGSVQIALADGTMRTLLDPKQPSITISADNEKYIDATRDVFIEFSILPSGAVSPGSIRITPASLLHRSIEDEIKAQIAKWRFQEASSSGQVSFKYNIIKR